MSNLEEALKKINKEFGSGTIRTLGDTSSVTCKTLSTGSLMIDKILGGGIGCGRIAEIYGDFGSGKSTLCLQLSANCQKEGGKVAYIDSENALDVEYARKLGVNVDDLIFTQPSNAEAVFDIARELACTGEVRLIIIDSVASLCPKAELEGEAADMTIGLLARLMSKELRKLTGLLTQNDCTMVFINQLRDKINTGFSMGDTTTTSGGRALKFFASQRVELKKIGQIKEKDEVVGNNVKVKITKNRLTAPMQVCEVPLMFGRGFNAEDEVFDIALAQDLCQQSGAWYTSHDGKRVQGKAGLKNYYKENPESYEQLRAKVVAIISGKLIIDDYNEVDTETGEILNAKGND